MSVTSISAQSEIPNAPFYVTCIDKFMSGWGHSRNAQNKLIFVCENQVELQAVYNNCLKRSDFIYVHECSTKPKVRSYQFTQVKTKEDYPNFYKPGYF